MPIIIKLFKASDKKIKAAQREIRLSMNRETKVSLNQISLQGKKKKARKQWSYRNAVSLK